MTAKKVDRIALMEKLVTALNTKENAAQALEASDVKALQKTFAAAAKVVDEANEALNETYFGGDTFDFDWGW
jgi:hypothetical protein